MLYKSFEVSVKSADDDVKDGGSITAYAATFDRDPDSYGDVIAKGAFTDTLKAWKDSGNSIPLLFGHRTDDPMMNIGAVTDIKEDDKGLLITAKFDPDSEIAQYTRKLVIEKRLTKMSFAYDVEDRGTIELDGIEANELRKLNLYEVSLVPIPANQHAVVVDAKAADLTDDENADDANSLIGDGDSALSTGDDTTNRDEIADEEIDDGAIQKVLDAITSLSVLIKESFAALSDAVSNISAPNVDEADEPKDEQNDDDEDSEETDDETNDEANASDDLTSDEEDMQDDNEEAGGSNSEDQTDDESDGDDDDDEDSKPKKNADIEATLAKMARYQAL